MAEDIFTTAARLRSEHTPFVLATVVASYPPQSVRPGAKAIVHTDGTIDGWVGGGCVRPVVVQEARDALGDGRPRLVRMNVGTTAPAHHGDVREYPMTCQGEGGVEIYLEPVIAAPRLVVLGRTPVAQSLARLGAELGFDVVETDDAATALAGADASTWVVVATMGAGDEETLTVAAASDAGYVGLVASRKKGTYLLDYARSCGVSDERLARVKCPAGLDLGGMSASEIALSIAAELVQMRYREDAGFRRHDDTTDRHPGESRGMPAKAGILPFPVDPVCGMPVNPAEAKHTLVVGGETLYFCCPHCKRTYERRLTATEPA